MTSLDRVNSSALAKDSGVPIKEKFNMLEPFAANVRTWKQHFKDGNFRDLHTKVACRFQVQIRVYCSKHTMCPHALIMLDPIVLDSFKRNCKETC